jgi:carboxymethylenebutenolidase
MPLTRSCQEKGFRHPSCAATRVKTQMALKGLNPSLTMRPSFYDTGTPSRLRDFLREERRLAMPDHSDTSATHLGSVFDARVRHEFVDHDVDATMQTMVPECYLLQVPTLTGGAGPSQVRQFCAEHFVGRWPADTTVTQVSRTVGDTHVVDEQILRFTHDVSLAFMLPGVPPTGKQVQLPVVVRTFEQGKIAHEHIYWDQASLLLQVGLLAPKMLPVIGVDQAGTLLDQSLPLNMLISRIEANLTARPAPSHATTPDSPGCITIDMAFILSHS